MVVATSSFGMGYDNLYITFVIHFQSPGSPIAYYQQVGRAGRAVGHSVGVLMSGAEDTDIQDYFIDSAFPSERLTEAVIGSLREAPKKLTELEREVNLGRGRLTGLLKILEVEGAITRDGSTWRRSRITGAPWARGWASTPPSSTTTSATSRWACFPMVCKNAWNSAGHSPLSPSSWFLTNLLPG